MDMHDQTAFASLPLTGRFCQQLLLARSLPDVRAAVAQYGNRLLAAEHCSVYFTVGVMAAASEDAAPAEDSVGPTDGAAAEAPSLEDSGDGQISNRRSAELGNDGRAAIVEDFSARHAADKAKRAEEGIHCVAVAALPTRPGSAGELEVIRRGGTFSHEDLRGIDQVARLIGAAVERILQVDDMRSRAARCAENARRYQVLSSMSARLTTATSRAAVLELAAQSLSEALPASGIMFYRCAPRQLLVLERDGSLKTTDLDEPTERSQPRRLIEALDLRGQGLGVLDLGGFDQRVTLRAYLDDLIAGGKSKIEHRLDAHPLPAMRALATDKFAAFMIAPLVCTSGAFGTMSAVRGAEQHPFTEQDLVMWEASAQGIILHLDRVDMLAEAHLARREAQAANEAKSRFLAHMSHEIRTPMSAVLGYAQLLEQEVNGLQRKEHAAALGRAGAHLLNVINDILDISKIEAGAIELHAEPVRMQDIELALAEMLSVNCAGREVKWLVNNALPGNYTVRADRGKITQILMNLVGNAIKFTNEGEIELRFYASGDQTCVMVRDTGCGIDEEMQGAVFEPFRQVRGGSSGGSGLGLAISKQLAEMMGGGLALKSTPGVGTTVTFAAPLPQLVGIVQPPTQKPSVYGFQGAETLRAVVIDSDQDNREVVAAMLKQAGMAVVSGGGGADSYRLIIEAAPHVALLGLRTPSLNDLVLRCRQTQPGQATKYLVMTASPFGFRREDAVRAGFHDVVSKPFDRRQLLELIGRVLDRDVLRAPVRSGVKVAHARAVHLSLPPALADALRVACDHGSASRALQSLATFEQTASAEVKQQHANDLAAARELIEKYDLETLASRLGRSGSPGASAVNVLAKQGGLSDGP